MGPAEVTGPGGLDHFFSPLRLRWLHVERAWWVDGRSSLFFAVHDGEATESQCESCGVYMPGLGGGPTPPRVQDSSTTLPTVQGGAIPVLTCTVSSRTQSRDGGSFWMEWQ